MRGIVSVSRAMVVEEGVVVDTIVGGARVYENPIIAVINKYIAGYGIAAG